MGALLGCSIMARQGPKSMFSIQVPAPTIISTIISIIISIITSILVSIIVSIIISIMINIIIIVMNVNTLIVNISTISLIHTSSMNDIQNNISMARYNGRAVTMAMYMMWIAL